MNASGSSDVKMKDSNVLIFGDIGDWYGLNKSNLFTALQGKTSEDVIHFYLNSPGGNLQTALDIYDLIKASPAQAVMHLFGLVGSAATVIACAGDEITMTEQTIYMIHEAASGAWGTKRELRKQADITEKFENRAISIYQKTTGLSTEAITELLEAESFMEPQQALELGFVDSVVEHLEVDFELEVDSTNERCYDYYDYYYKADMSGYDQTIYNCISNKIYPIDNSKVDRLLKIKNSLKMATDTEKKDSLFKRLANKIVAAMSQSSHIKKDDVDKIVNELAADEELASTVNEEAIKDAVAEVIAEGEAEETEAHEELLQQYEELDDEAKAAFLESLGVEVTDSGEEDGEDADAAKPNASETEDADADVRQEMAEMKLQIQNMAALLAKKKTTKKVKKTNGDLGLENNVSGDEKKVNSHHIAMYKKALDQGKITKAMYDKYVKGEA